MEEDEFYVYPGIYYHCGACASSLSPYQPGRRPYKPKVCCFNPDCPKFLIVFTIGDEARVPVYETGERAEDPRNAAVANAYADGFAGAGAGLNRAATNFRDVAIPAELADNIHNLGRARET